VKNCSISKKTLKAKPKSGKEGKEEINWGYQLPKKKGGSRQNQFFAEETVGRVW